MRSNQLTFFIFQGPSFTQIEVQVPKKRLWSIRKKTEVLTVTVVVIPSINVVAFVVHVPHAPGYFADLFALYGN